MGHPEGQAAFRLVGHGYPDDRLAVRAAQGRQVALVRSRVLQHGQLGRFEDPVEVDPQQVPLAILLVESDVMPTAAAEDVEEVRRSPAAPGVAVFLGGVLDWTWFRHPSVPHGEVD